MSHIDSFKCRKTLTVAGKEYVYYSLTEAEKNGLEGISKLPFSMKVLLENLLRFEDDRSVKKSDIEAVAKWLNDRGSAGAEIAYRPARVLMQDFTGVPAVVDLAAMRDGLKNLGGDPEKINPLVPVDLVIDHSVIVDEFGNPSAFKANVDLEYQRNGERYRFLKWGQQAFKNFRVVPPGTGICHQVNLEYLAQAVWTKEEDGVTVAYPDTCVGTDSHTTMVNGLGVLGWGVGGIEAEASMLGQPVSMLLPEVIGFRLTGKVKEGVTATDLVLTVTQMLRKKGVVGKFVEFFGPGLDNMTLADRATIANMGPEYGATCGFFPIDKETLNYMNTTGREEDRIALVEAYSRAQGMWREADSVDPVFTDVLELDMSEVVPSMAGPKRPEGRIALEKIASGFATSLETEYKKTTGQTARYAVEGEDYDLGHGDVAIAAITSCTNTSNPSVLIAAGLLARNAVAKGLKTKPWVKTSLAPGSQVVAAYLESAGLQKDLDALGFNLVGFGCTTCIGNSGPLPAPISKTINEKGLIAAAVLSGNRNFEGRVSPDVQANYLASPPLVVAHALAGTVTKDLTKEPLGEDQDGNPVFLRDIWPSSAEIQEFIAKNVTRKIFSEKYADVFKGDENWQAVQVPAGQTYAWDDNSTYVQNPPYFVGMGKSAGKIGDVKGARILGLFGDKITTDHISPAGSIKAQSPAGKYLIDHGVGIADFNQYGTRRGNHEVMMRGTFANIRIRNHMLGENGREGGYTIHYPSKEETSIYDAAMEYKAEGVPLVVFAGVEYGNGSSRDWAAKGTNLLGVKAVIAQSFERIHRSNLVGMGIVPFVFEEGTSWQTLGLKGDEIVSIEGLADVRPRQKVDASITYADGTVKKVPLICRIDTLDELDYMKNGGILQTVLRDLAA
ncbi:MULTISPECIES: aconitate hydratase AcnA [Brucella]|uniref:Aconitate hydratase n=2 Tax=Brucella pituitosa TaxID=571256 RepID=A0A643F3Z1_9HYPH|nr:MULTISPECIES: aconitate hydratase AcnA [Brucella]PQZ49134.1 aconitate hydratase AcnA [Ochrobactrum sp. MYb19]PRA57661.1 aconitate hydratase AcnA [Ochrobactrum sp. MYb68]PRA67048.1 aconitate hydratase AcnA [Ochrobactrum sp. MYb18]PRA75922.1 aconitate hydratase AcnA [Brucella thiophenivorans]PRA92059.1 aconitate hydratase AcnA [Ochrobactrum sp. MYb14]PRA97928.1 aconitate hydratase AcnA [Ochrobactrum sp. MYb15]TCQ81999.1 aconitase [Ochrobactrum sp. BH3]